MFKYIYTAGLLLVIGFLVLATLFGGPEEAMADRITDSKTFRVDDITDPSQGYMVFYHAWVDDDTTAAHIPTTPDGGYVLVTPPTGYSYFHQVDFIMAAVADSAAQVINFRGWVSATDSTTIPAMPLRCAAGQQVHYSFPGKMAQLSLTNIAAGDDVYLIGYYK